MKPVDRSELLGLGAYEQIRDRFRERVIGLKRNRRVILGSNMSMVFENHDTVLLQIQEMLRTERITDERAITHELETYNELIPAPMALSATLFIEYEEPGLRRTMLGRFATLRERIHLRIGSGQVTARFGTHFGEEMDRLPAVNYLTFEVGPALREILADSEVPAALEISHPDYPLSVALQPELRRELLRDLS
jgi:hypothetical protein